jgi:hypothetical protein
MNVELVPTSWQVPGQAFAVCELEIHRFDGLDQLRRAALRGGFFLVLAAATVPIPIVHIFAPALFLALAIGFVVHSLRVNEIAVAARGLCTGCQQHVDADLGKVRVRFPLWSLCPICRERLSAQAPAAAAEKL